MDRQSQRPRGRGRDNRPAWLVQQQRDTSTTTTSSSIGENEQPPLSKKPRIAVETVSEEEPRDTSIQEEEPDDPREEELLLQALDGDEFVSQEEKEAEAARQRRLKRKQRLQHSAGDAVQKYPVATTTDTASNSDMKQPIENSNGTLEVLEKEKENVDLVNGNSVPNGSITKEEEDDDEFDMFSSSVSPPPRAQATSLKVNQTGDDNTKHHQQDWDDEEGYYKATIGELIDLGSGDRNQDHRFRVQGIVGKGVFSTVLKCETLDDDKLPQVTALKLIRHNDTMTKAALTEIRFLQKLHDCNGIIKMYLPQTKILEHRGHTCLVFDYAPYNLRHVLRKFGRGVGLSLTGVRAYFVQLIGAIQHLEKHGLIHADLKPDNILVSEDFGTVQLCDFGSAFEVGSDSTPTPYLVSRFYRAPEIVLGLIPTPAVDLWSVAATIGELFLGTVLFDGRSNNDMLLRFMECLGAFSNRTLRQHLMVCQKYPVPKHFDRTSGGTFEFLHQTADKVTGKAVTVSRTLKDFPKRPLQQLLLQARSAGDSRVQLLQLSNLMQKCLVLDPTRRIALSDALRHDFFQTTTTVPKAQTDEKAA